MNKHSLQLGTSACDRLSRQSILYQKALNDEAKLGCRGRSNAELSTADYRIIAAAHVRAR